MTDTQKNKDLLLEPVVTYKTSTLASQNKCYTFRVARDANKHQIAQAFVALFGGKVSGVNTTAIRAHSKRTRKGYKRQADGKKAYIFADGVELNHIFPQTT